MTDLDKTFEYLKSIKFTLFRYLDMKAVNLPQSFEMEVNFTEKYLNTEVEEIEGEFVSAPFLFNKIYVSRDSFKTTNKVGNTMRGLKFLDGNLGIGNGVYGFDNSFIGDNISDTISIIEFSNKEYQKLLDGFSCNNHKDEFFNIFIPPLKDENRIKDIKKRMTENLIAIKKLYKIKAY